MKKFLIKNSYVILYTLIIAWVTILIYNIEPLTKEENISFWKYQRNQGECFEMGERYSNTDFAPLYDECIEFYNEKIEKELLKK